MHRTVRHTAATILMATAAWFTAGCGGATLGENKPGQDTPLEGTPPARTQQGGQCRFNGSLGVDPLTDTVWVLDEYAPVPCKQVGDAQGGTRPVKVLRTVDPSTGSVATHADLTDASDVRVLFPASGVLVMAEQGVGETLTLYDRDTGKALRERTTATKYHGTRMAPSRKWVVVADNAADGPPPLVAIDPTTLAAHVLPQSGWYVEGQWLHARDTFAGISFVDSGDDQASPAERYSAHLLQWHFEPPPPGTDAPQEMPYVTQGPVLGASFPDVLMSMSWVAVSPDDSVVAVVVRHMASGDPPNQPLSWTPTLLLWRVETGQLDTYEGVQGSVAFTPDGSTVVAWANEKTAAGDFLYRLVAFDVTTGAREDIPLANDSLPTYYVTPAGHLVAVAAALGGDDVVLVDLDTATSHKLTGLRVKFDEFVVRPAAGEMWVVDDGLFRLDFLDATWETVSLPWTPLHINRLRKADQLVLDDDQGGVIHLLDPTTGAPGEAIPLGPPPEAQPTATPPRS